MKRYPRMTSRLLPLTAIALCAFFAAKALGHLVEARLSAASPRGPGASRPRPTPAAPARAPRDIRGILDRNIFCSTCTVTAGEAGEAGEAQDADPSLPTVGGRVPVKSSLALILLATLISPDGDGGDKWALIVGPGSAGAASGDGTDEAAAADGAEAVRVYGVGHKLPGGAVVVEILDKAVLIENGGKLEYLALAGQDAPPGEMAVPPAVAGRAPHAPGLRLPKPIKGLQEVADGITRTSGMRYEISRAVMERVLNDPEAFARGGRLIPMRGSSARPAGLRFFGRRGSLGSLLGIFGGDLIHQINGSPVTTKKELLETLRGLRGSSNITVTLDRKGQRLNHDYAIR